MESVSERSARYMTMLESSRTGWQDDIRAKRTASQGIRSRNSCDTIIDTAIQQVARESLTDGKDYGNAELDSLRANVKTHIDTQLAAKEDRGYRLGE